MNLALETLMRLRAEGTYRTLENRDRLIDFCSNDYLGLANDEAIRQALKGELEKQCPIGATGSALISGYGATHERVERVLESVFRAESALLFPTGFMANLGVTCALAEAEFFSDELNHASLIDGMRLTRARTHIFTHNDLDHLEQSIKACTARHRAIITESVFSQEGDLAPIDELVRIAERYDAWLVVDEAHATGIFGPRGLGRLEEISYEKLIAVHTASKALGGQGAFVLSNRDVRELIINRARSYIFSTALSPLLCLQIEHAINAVLTRKSGDGARLLKKANDFLQALPEELRSSSSSPIVPIILGSNEKALCWSEKLRARGFHVRAIRSPTVARGRERLRLSLKSTHLSEDLESLTEALAKLAST